MLLSYAKTDLRTDFTLYIGHHAKSHQNLIMNINLIQYILRYVKY